MPWCYVLRRFVYDYGMQSIDELVTKIKHWLDILAGDWGIAAILILVGLGSFGLGRLSVLENVRPPVSIAEAPSESKPRGMNIGGLIVASISGNSYYFPWCAGAAKIALQNEVWFASEAEARSAGYSPAKNCKGLQ